MILCFSIAMQRYLKKRAGSNDSFYNIIDKIYSMPFYIDERNIQNKSPAWKIHAGLHYYKLILPAGHHGYPANGCITDLYVYFSIKRQQQVNP